MQKDGIFPRLVCFQHAFKPFWGIEKTIILWNGHIWFIVCLHDEPVMSSFQTSFFFLEKLQKNSKHNDHNKLFQMHVINKKYLRKPI